MISNFKLFQSINENKFEKIKNKYNSLGEYVEHLYEIIDDKTEFQRVLGEYLKVDKKKYNTKSFKEGDYVLIEYWYKDILTPVKIKEKKGRKYVITHNIEDSQIKNAPDETILKDRIVDHYKITQDSKQEKNINTDIRISNAVNMLKPYDQMILVKKIQDAFQIDEKIKFELEETKDITLLGKTGFNSFMKVVSALNLPEVDIDRENCPKDFFIIYISEKLNRERLLKILNRFRSMKQIINFISKSNEPLRIYFGLKYDNTLYTEYGLIKGDNRVQIGEFKLSKSNWIKLLEHNSKTLGKLKEEIKDIEISDLKQLMKIKKSISNFTPGYYHEKSNPYIEDNVLIQSYYGTGKWNTGVITQNSFNDIKEKFKKWVIDNNLNKKISFNIKPEKFWIHIKIKLK
jgi:hypothetical protein